MDMAINDDTFIDLLVDRLVDKALPLLEAKLDERDQLEKYDYDVTAKYLYTKIFKTDSTKFNKIQALPGFPTNPNPGGNPTYNLKEVLIWRHESQVRH